MAKSQIIWTILPYGTINKHYRVSVVVSPRLTPERPKEHILEKFSDFLNWPNEIEKAKFSAEIADIKDHAGPKFPLKLISEVDKDLWGELFNEETPVNGFMPPNMGRVNFRSYSIRNILGYTKEYYAKLAVSSPYSLPRLLPWDGANTDLKAMLEKVWPDTEKPTFSRFFYQDFWRLDPTHYGKDLFNTTLEYELYRADRFYRRRRITAEERAMRRPDFQNIPGPPKVPEYDFHHIVASLADFPKLLRRLGLVLDFVLESPFPMSKEKLRLHIDWGKGIKRDDDVTPWTRFSVDEDRFYTSSRPNSDQNAGLLNLSNSNDSYTGNASQFDIYQVDPDGTALKTVNFTIVAQNLVKKHFPSNNSLYGEVTYTTGDEQGVAALRSGGLGVSRHDRTEGVNEDVAATALKNEALNKGEGNDILLYAEDVFRGYRVDVADVPNTSRRPDIWRSLCARIGDYRLGKNNKKIELEPDEGYVCGASTTSEEPGSQDHYLHESLFRWTGWSLCTPRPGLTLKAEQVGESQIQSETPCEIKEHDEDGYGVSATFSTPQGSLPVLRYGHLYRFRARIVDLAGNSLAANDPSLATLPGASDAVGYWRFEPIDPPVIVHRTRVSEGESLERMVIRSNYDAPPEEYWQTLPKSEDFEYGTVNERHFVPPKSSQQQCETHGLFDPYFGGWEKIKEGYRIAAEREAGTLYDELPGSKIQIITPTELNGIATTTDAPPSLPSPDNPVGDRMAGGQYIIHAEEQITTPWLPDGAAGGTAIRAAEGHELPGVQLPSKRDEISLGSSCTIKRIPGKTNGYVILVSNAKEWPYSSGFRLILAERAAKIDSSLCTETFLDNGEPVWKEAERTLTFFVAKGRIVRLVYSSFAHETFIDGFGIPQWVQGNNDREFVRDLALCGANWLIAPFRDLTLVHATQAPVFAPRFNALTLVREPGSHDVMLKAELQDERIGGISLHGPSTGKFEVEAEWEEWADDPLSTEPKPVKYKGQLGEIKLAEGHRNDFNLAAVVKTQSPDPNNPKLQQQRGDVHALGDTRFRLIDYRIRATTRFREYLPPPIYENQDNVTQLGPVANLGLMLVAPPSDDPGAPVLGIPMPGCVLKTAVLASAPPADPRVLYIVPTMRWQRTSDQADNHDVTRLGNGLRVWLDRPWFSSGDGELIGVVVFRGTGTVPDELQPLVTQWGRDPFWVSSQPTLPKRQDFTGGVTWEEGVALQENSAMVDIVGHRVHWDGDRRLWYCDIAIDPLTTYMPFVRLALVRYQPNALPGVKISKVVLTDFAQVLPHRRATVNVDGNRITASLRGPNPNSGPISGDNKQQTGRNRVELVLQTRDPLDNSDLAWEDTQTLVSQEVGIGTHNISGSPFWEGNATLPPKTDRPRRLMLREFERFYTNASKNEIEERLVFADIYQITRPIVCYLNRNYDYSNGQRHHELHTQHCGHKPHPRNCYYVGEYLKGEDSFKDAKDQLLDMYVSMWSQAKLAAGEIEKRKSKIVKDIANGKIIVDGCYYCMRGHHTM